MTYQYVLDNLGHKTESSDISWAEKHERISSLESSKKKKMVLAALSHKTKQMPFASNVQPVPDAFVL